MYGSLLYIGDEQLPTILRFITSHYIRITINQSVQWNVTRVLFLVV